MGEMQGEGRTCLVAETDEGLPWQKVRSKADEPTGFAATTVTCTSWPGCALPGLALRGRVWGDGGSLGWERWMAAPGSEVVHPQLRARRV